MFFVGSCPGAMRHCCRIRTVEEPPMPDLPRKSDSGPSDDFDAPTELRDIGNGSLVGGCKVLSTLGECGFGLVYLAESRPIRRRVVLKVIKPGVASKQVIARFEAGSGDRVSRYLPGVVA